MGQRVGRAKSGKITSKVSSAYINSLTMVFGRWLDSVSLTAYDASAIRTVITIENKNGDNGQPCGIP